MLFFSIYTYTQVIVVNYSSSIIRWVCWVRLFHSWTMQAHFMTQQKPTANVFIITATVWNCKYIATKSSSLLLHLCKEGLPLGRNFKYLSEIAYGTFYMSYKYEFRQLINCPRLIIVCSLNIEKLTNTFCLQRLPQVLLWNTTTSFSNLTSISRNISRCSKQTVKNGLLCSLAEDSVTYW